MITIQGNGMSYKFEDAELVTVRIEEVRPWTFGLPISPPLILLSILGAPMPWETNREQTYRRSG